MLSITILAAKNGLGTPKNGEIAKKNLKIGLNLTILWALYVCSLIKGKNALK